MLQNAVQIEMTRRAVERERDRVYAIGLAMWLFGFATAIAGCLALDLLHGIGLIS